MAFSTPFERLPVEIIISIIGDLESPEAVQDLIRADSHILRLFLGNRHLILRPLRHNVYHLFPDKNLTQAAVACRLRQIEGGVPPRTQTCAHAEEVMSPLLAQSPKPLSVAQLSLGAISKLYQLCREAEIFTTGFSRESWRMTQDWVCQDVHEDYEDHEDQKDLGDRLPMSLPLSKKEEGQIQKCYLLFDACRHTLNFTASFLQDFDLPERSSYNFHIPYSFIYQDKLLCVRAFQTVFRFVFKKYKHLLEGIHDRVDYSISLHRLHTKCTPWVSQRKEFLNRSFCDHLQFVAYLCSQGYYLLLESQELDDIMMEERIISLYMRFSQFKKQSLTSPLVVSAHLQYSLNNLCHGADSCREFWASGAFIWDKKRLLQFGAEEEVFWPLIEGNSSRDESEGDSDL